MFQPIDPNTTMGAASLSVGDLPRSLAYYQEHIGLSVLDQSATSATLGVAGTPLLRLHHAPGARLIRRATGLYHFAIRVPTRHDLARVIAHFAQARTPIGGASDHYVSEALYLSDPDGHGIEIYRDRPRSEWRYINGQLQMATVALDIDSIIGELGDNEPAWTGMPAGTDMGHMHLQVANIAAAERFYVDVLGFERIVAMPSASFLGAGGYHHHLGMNTWAGVGVPPAPAEAARLLNYELLVPGEQALDEVLGRVRAAELPLDQNEHGWLVRDPSQIAVVLRTA